jgi:signal transduction histidine kinase
VTQTPTLPGDTAAPPAPRPASRGRRHDDPGRAAPVRPPRIGPRLDARTVHSLGHLGSLVTILRWASLAVGVILLPTIDHPENPVLLVAIGILLANTIFRTIRPPRLQPATWRAEAMLLLDLALAVLMVVVTGDWASPLILTPLPTVILAAYAWGYREGLAAAALTGATIALADTLSGVGEDALRTGVMATVVVLLAALVGGFTRQLWLEAERRQQETLDQVTRMSIANDLLHALHDVVQTLPSSLDLSDVVASAQQTFRELVDSTVAVVIVPDDTSDAWQVELAEGVRMPATLLPDELPLTLDRALTTYGVIRVNNLTPGTGAACGPETQSILTTALRAHDRVVGLVSIEHSRADAYTEEDASLIAGLASSLALAVDNARWFSRLRTLGAEAERARIARDLHDNVAQSLAYVGFELDRLATAHGDDPELKELQGVVRGVVVELRETLYQLRATVSESQDLVEVAQDYINRWSKRTGVAAEFSARTEGRRVPVQVEQELWRILQESLTNVERHADASHAWISWRIGDGRAQLEVRDDGRGMNTDVVSRERYGLVGIRERADAVGAQVTLVSEPENGTTVLVELEVPQ